MSGQLIAADEAGPQEFKQRIYKHLKKSGVVSSLKSQLRSQLLEQLRKLSDPDASRAATGLHDQKARSMWHSAVNSLVTEYLQASNFQFTLSVFNSEADVAEQPAFSSTELCQLMRLDRQPQLLERVQRLMQTEGCLVMALLQALSAGASGHATVDSSCQTSTAGQMEGLGQRLLQLEDAYVKEAAVKHQTVSRVTLDEQMASYKQECDALVEVQVAARVARIKEVELAAARQEAAAKYRQQLELDRAELERIHADRLARLAVREDEVTEKLRRQQRDVESVAYAQRQRILAEEERIRGMKAEVSRQLEVQEQLLKGLEAQLKEREKAVMARETAAEAKLAEAAELETKLAAAARKQAAAELSEEQAALRGERVALEAERARVTELRQSVNADLAVARAKEDRLRALESARAEAEARSAAHAAGEEVLRLQLRHLQAEVAALQQELVRAGAAVGASAAAAGDIQLYPSGEAGAAAAAVGGGSGGPVQLPQVLRELGQWQRRAQEAELTLVEATVERDSAVSRAEELTVSLNAARREISALRSQVSRQQQDIIQLKLHLSHANAAAAAAGSRNALLGLRGSIGSARGVPFRTLASPVPGAPGFGQSPPRGLGGLGLGSASYATGGFSASPAPGLQPRSHSAAGLYNTVEPAPAADVGQGSLRQVFGSAGGVDEVQVTASRIAQLAAADANMNDQLQDFRRRSASQRAAAARQLADLKAVAGRSSGGGAAAGSKSGAAAAVPTGPGDVSRQCRLSIPPEFDTAGIEAEHGTNDVCDEDLMQQQQRRVALEAALQPPAAPAMHFMKSAVVTDAQTTDDGGSKPANAAVGVYRLEDVLRAVGGVKPSTSNPEQQEELSVGSAAANDPRLVAAAAADAARAVSSSTELSFVGHVKQSAAVGAQTHEVNSRANDAWQQQLATGSDADRTGHSRQPVTAVADAVDPTKAAVQHGQGAYDAAAASDAAENQLYTQRQQQQGMQFTNSQQPPAGSLISRHDTASLVEGAPTGASADLAAVFSCSGEPAAVPEAAVMEDQDNATMSSLVNLPQGMGEGSDDYAEEDHPAADAASTTDVVPHQAEPDDIAEGFDLSDDFVAELSAMSSAVAAVESAADAEEARLSGSSVALTTASGRGVDRYGTCAATDGFESDDDQSQRDHLGPELLTAAEFDAHHAGQYEAQPTQQRSPTARAGSVSTILQESAESKSDSPLWAALQQQQQHRSDPQGQRQGAQAVSEQQGSDESHVEGSYASDEEDEYDLEGAARGPHAVGDAVASSGIVDSPQSSEGSVF